jgi:Kef-type K+ transport system membrane component KefB
MRLTLGQFLVGMAAVEVIVFWLMLRALPPDATAERRQGMRIVLAAAVAMGIAFCLVALLVPSVSEIALI